MRIRVWHASGLRAGEFAREEAMPILSGEAIRMMNYVDDIAATLRRINSNMPFMTDEEKKKVAEYMRTIEPNYGKIIDLLEGK
jgi:hypothetical protein